MNCATTFSFPNFFRAEPANNTVGKIIGQIKVESVFKDLYKDIVNDFLTNNGHSRKSQQKSINKKVEVLKTRIANLENKYADNEISTIDFNKMNGRFSNELKSLESQSESEEKYRVSFIALALHSHSVFCTRSRNRTGTTITGHWILSPARLPIPPPGQRLIFYIKKNLIPKKSQLSGIFKMSEKRDSNPRPRPWQGRALPTELFSQ